MWVCCSESTKWEARLYLHHYSMTFLSPSTAHLIFEWVGTLTCVFPEPLTTSLLIEKWGVATPCTAMILSRPQCLPTPGECLRKLKWTFWKTSKVWERALLVLLHEGTKHSRALRTRTTGGPTHITSTETVGTGTLWGSENPKENLILQSLFSGESEILVKLVIGAFSHISPSSSCFLSGNYFQTSVWKCPFKWRLVRVHIYTSAFI